MPTDTDRFFSELRDEILVAERHYEIWWVYKNRRPEFVDVMNEFVMFFSLSISAHFVAMLIPLYKLFETRRNTINIPQVFKTVIQDNSVSPGDIDRIQRKLDEAKKIWIKVGILRSECFAHTNLTLNTSQVFQKADITPDEIKSLIEQVKDLLIELSVLHSGTPISLQHYHSEKATVRMLNTLKGALEQDVE